MCNVRCAFCHTLYWLDWMGSYFPDSGLSFFLKRLVVGHKRTQVEKVVDVFEPSLVHDDTSTGRVSSARQLRLQQFFVTNDQNLKASQAAAQRSISDWRPVFAVWNESSIVCKQQFTYSRRMCQVFVLAGYLSRLNNLPSVGVPGAQENSSSDAYFWHRHWMQKQRSRIQTELDPKHHLALRHFSSRSEATEHLQIR